jgi:branched-chain amino acid transport system substrate-binding protein
MANSKLIGMSLSVAIIFLLVGLGIGYLVYYPTYDQGYEAGFAAGAASIIPQEPIRIGWMGPLTGYGSAEGRTGWQGITMAVEDINSDGGIDGRLIELHVYDTATDPKQGVTVARKLIEQDKVVATITTGYDVTVLAVAPLFQEASIPYITALDIHPETLKLGDHIFRAFALPVTAERISAYHAINVLGYEKFAVLYNELPFGEVLFTDFKEAVEDYGGSVVYSSKHPVGEQDYSSYLTSISASGADALVGFNLYFEGSIMINQASEMGLDLPTIGWVGWHHPTFLEIAGDNANGAIGATYYNSENPDPFAQNFLSEFRARYGVDPDNKASVSYDALYMLKLAIESKGATDVGILEGLKEITSFEGASNRVHGFVGGQAIQEITIYTIEDLTYKAVTTYDDLDLITPYDGNPYTR